MASWWGFGLGGRACCLVGLSPPLCPGCWGWVGGWFVNSGREHLVAIREFNDIARSTCECVVCGVLGLCFVSFVVVFLVECL